MTPPMGSTIRVEDEWGTPKLVLPHKASPWRYLFIPFIIFWLGGWAFGWQSAFNQITSTNAGPKGFLIFWLGGWTIGGIFAVLMLYRLASPGVPETLVLAKPALRYDSGVAPMKIGFDYRSQMEVWKRMFARRKQLTLEPENLRTLKLREFDGGNRLTVDCGAERIELGTSLSEIEREWLYKALVEYYVLPGEKNAEGIPAGAYI